MDNKKGKASRRSLTTKGVCEISEDSQKNVSSKIVSRIADLLLIWISEIFPRGKIYAVGSLASNELTIIKRDFGSRELLVSDFDIIVFVDILTYLRSRIFNIERNLSKTLTSILRLKGFKSHVSIGITSHKLLRFLPSLGPNTVYLYEMRQVRFAQNKVTFSPSKFYVQPNKVDSLNLIFSSLADYIFMKFDLIGNLTIYEKIYIVAKRYATIIYSLLLFKGKQPTGYLSLIEQAKKNFNELQNVISYADLEILETLIKYKISGNPKVLVEQFQLIPKDMDKMLLFLCNNFEKLALKVLAYELNSYFSSYGKFSNGKHRYRVSNNLSFLLDMYKLEFKKSTTDCFMSLASYLISFLIDRDRKKLALRLHSLIEERLEISDFLRHLVGKLFLFTASGYRDVKKLRHFALYIKTLWDLFMM